MQTGRVFDEIVTAVADDKTLIINKGGTRSGKTFSTLQFLLWYAQSVPKIIISVIGETMPFLKRGCITDIKVILGSAFSDKSWNKTDSIYTLQNGSIIEFFSADNESKIHGSARDVLFINECFFIGWEIYRQLALRTRTLILLDYNPRARFWVDDNLINREECALIHSTYKDNPYLTPRQIAEIEAYKDDAQFWRVYGLGLTGSVEGLIYTKWAQISELSSTGYKKEFWCIDFGFTNDPTTILHCRQMREGLEVDEVCYLPNMLNSDIAKALITSGATKQSLIVADSAEPKSIAEINTFGLRVVPASKGAGSISAGIGAVQALNLLVTQQSINTINELRNYMWKRDKEGKYINEPIDKYNHALDALRYGVTQFLWVNPIIKRPKVTRHNTTNYNRK